METVEHNVIHDPQALFNNDVEAAIRALVILEALYPRTCNLSELTWFDHALISTGDFSDGPSSLHPASAIATGEMLVRRDIVKAGLRILVRLHLIDETFDESGISYQSGEEAPSFLDLLKSPYNCGLKSRAEWLSNRYRDKTASEIESDIRQTVDRWTSEIIAEEPHGLQI